VVTPELSLLIVNYNSWKECQGALESFARHAPTRRDGSAMPYEAIVVDNASPIRRPKWIEAVRELAEATGGKLILHDENGGYSKGMNLALSHARGRWIVISNPDVVFSAGCVDHLVRYLEDHPDAGCAVPRGFWDEDHMGRLPPNILPTLSDVVWHNLAEYSAWARRRYTRHLLQEARSVWEATGPMELRMMSGCLFVMERATIEAMGGLLDERYPLYYEDADLSVRLHKEGRGLVQVSEANLVHLYNRSGQTDIGLITERNAISRRLYYRKWYGRPGEWLLRLGDWFRRGRLGTKLAARIPLPAMVDLGTCDGPPRLSWEGARSKVLVQMSMDARFYLAGAVYATGDSWTPSPGMFEQFGPYTYFLRAMDISGAEPVELGRWRYTFVGHPPDPADAVPAGSAAEDPSPAAPAEGQG